jgi:hypothetical protein
MSIESIVKEVVEELEQAEAKFGGFNSSHEGYAVLLEEVDELWDIVKLNPKKIMLSEQEFLACSELESNYDTTQWPHTLDIPKIQAKKHMMMMRTEAIQVAAMAIRFIKCVCEEDESK